MTSYKWGAVCYILWGIMHIIIGIQIFVLNISDSPFSVITNLYSDSGPISTPEQLGSVVSALMNQHAWNLVWFGAFATIVGVVWNWNNSKTAYWINLTIVTLADIGFIFAILIPGYISLWMGIWGPLLWIAAVVFSTMGINREKLSLVLSQA